MGSNQNIKLSSDLWSRITDIARAEGTSVNELLEEAVLRLVKLRDLRSFVAENGRLAAGSGLTEADVPRLVAESRRQRARR